MTSVDALVLIQNSWGEVDWILPVLRRLRDKGLRLLVHFPLQSVLDEGRSYGDLDACLRSVATVVGPEDVARAAARFRGRLRLALRALRAPHARLSGRLARARRLLAGDDPSQQCLPAELLHALTGGDPNWLLHDFSGQGHHVYHRTFPGSRLVLFPHGTVEYGLGSDHLRAMIGRRFAEQPAPSGSLLLVGTEASADFFRKATDIADVRPVGHPMLHAEWIETLRGHAPRDRGREPGLVLVLIPRRKFPDAARYAAMVRQVRDAARSAGLPLVLKTHPRQEKTEIEHILAELDHEPLVMASSLGAALVPGDVAVAFPSSSCNQAVANHVPVIEYFDFGAGQWPSFVQADGRRTSAFRMQGVVLAVSDPADLARTVARLASDPEAYRRAAETQWLALEQSGLLPPDSGLAACEALLDRTGTRSGRRDRQEPRLRDASWAPERKPST